MIFVFGSNLAGIHGAGAALYAHKNEGAIYDIDDDQHISDYLQKQIERIS